MSGKEAYYSQQMTDQLVSFIDSGLLTSNPAEAKTQFSAGSTRILANILTELNKPIIDPDTGEPVFLDRKSIDDTYKRLKSQVENYNEVFFGPNSNAGIVAAQGKAIKDRHNLDLWKDPVLAKVFSYPLPIQESIVASLRLTESDMPGLRESLRGLVTANDKAQAISSAMQGNPVDPALRNIATAASISGIDPAIATQDPQVFQNFLSQVAGEVSLINRNERPKAYLKIVRPEIANVVGNLPNPETAAENIRKVAQQQIEDLQRDIGPLIGNLRYGKDGVFVSTDQRANNTAAALNGVMGVLEIVDKHGTIRYGSRNELAKAFFNVNIGTAPTQIEPAQSPTQGGGGNTNLGGGAGNDTLVPNYGLRPDGTPKDVGWLGQLQLPSGKGVATEYSMQSQAVKDASGKQIDFPTLVPTLTEEEIQLMVTDIIPNEKDPPEPIIQKAIAHAKKRMAEGKSPFYKSGEPR